MNARAPVLKWLVSLKATACEADWEALYQHELPRIYSFFRYRIGDDALAEDLTSITSEQAWRGSGYHRQFVGSLRVALAAGCPTTCSPNWCETCNDSPFLCLSA